MIALSKITFNNYKALKDYQISIKNMNVLVGPNNCGKSTIISAFRILEIALRVAYTKTPAKIPHLEGYSTFGHSIPTTNLPVSTENVHTNYSDDDSIIEFSFSNASKLALYFPLDGGCYLTWQGTHDVLRSPKHFKKAFPYKIIVVPVLSTLENEENILADETVRAALGTHRASRHFRNYWYKNTDGFKEFSQMIADTWPGMVLKKPELSGKSVVMFCSENRLDREIYWSGSGFQIWCQLLTHISRANEFDLCIVDEPEIYLHPDVQRQLLGILRDINSSIIIATHSSEILAEADPAEILLINKNTKTAQRLRDAEGIQIALKALGSIQNVALTQIARTQKILFVEGVSDFSILRKFASKLKLKNLSSTPGFTVLESGGFGSWDKIKHFSWGIKQLGSDITIGSIYDRDYWPKEQLKNIKDELEEHLDFVKILEKKEIENYLIVPRCLERVIQNSLKETKGKSFNESIEEILVEITNEFYSNIAGVFLAKYSEFNKKTGKDIKTLNVEALQLLGESWNSIDGRLKITSGKEILKAFRTYISDKYQISFSNNKIINEMKIHEIDPEIVTLLNSLEKFRQKKN